MVTAADVEQALKQRLEAKDVVSVRFTRLQKHADCRKPLLKRVPAAFADSC